MIVAIPPVQPVSREDLEASLARLSAQLADPHAGILGPDSVGWRIANDLGLFAGGGCAALLQLAHPMVAYAIDEHSRTRTDVAGRFQRTFRNVFAMLFGDLDDAVAAARRVHAIHARISGMMPEAIGAWPANTPYHANDIDALRWVHATLLDSAVRMRERIDGPLPVEVKDAYVIELHRFGALFGIPAARLSPTWAAHEAYVEDMLRSRRLAVVPRARDLARFLFGRGSSSPQPPLGWLAEIISRELLPPRLADEFELRSAPRVARSAIATFVTVYRRIPRPAVWLPAYAEARRRTADRGSADRRSHAPVWWSKWIERQLFSLARRTTGS